MSLYRDTFKGKHTFLPVIHVEGGEQAHTNARIAFDEGADGVFLINHEIAYVQLIECYEHIRHHVPNFWIGLNCLDLGNISVEFIPGHTAGLWEDDGGITEGTNPVMAANGNKELRERQQWKGIYFGGVAFKGQMPIHDPAMAARHAIPFMDVITTSGTATGVAAPIEKIKAMKGGIGDHPLALASGVTVENIEEYKPYVDCFLVNTGVSDSFTQFNARKLREVAKKLGK